MFHVIVLLSSQPAFCVSSQDGPREPHGVLQRPEREIHFRESCQHSKRAQPLPAQHREADSSSQPGWKFSLGREGPIQAGPGNWGARSCPLQPFIWSHFSKCPVPTLQRGSPWAVAAPAEAEQERTTWAAKRGLGCV